MSADFSAPFRVSCRAAGIRARVLHVERARGGASGTPGGGVGLHRQLLCSLGRADRRRDRRPSTCTQGIHLILWLHEGKLAPSLCTWVLALLSVTKDRLAIACLHVVSGFPGGSAGKESAWNVIDLGSIPGLERSPREGNSYPLQYSGLENSIDCIVHRVAKSRTRLSDLHFTSLRFPSS